MIHPWWGGQEVDVGSWNDCAESGKPFKKRERRGGRRKEERKKNEGMGRGRRERQFCSCGGELETRLLSTHLWR